MKNLFILTMCLFLSFALFGQIPQAFNYQATVRNSDGEIQKNITANFEVEIIQNDSSIYSEQHLNINTGIIGVVNFKVGDGDFPSSDFSQINWSHGGLQIRVSLNGDEMGTSDIVAVPFALYSNKSGDNHWEKENNNIFYTEGNIGIGTTTPERNLHIVGDGFIKLEQPGLSNGEWGELNTTGLGTLRLFQHNNDGGGGIDILPNGYVGLGSASPNVRLLIDGGTDAELSEGGYLQINESSEVNIVIDNNEIMARNNGDPSSLFLQVEGGQFIVHSEVPGTQFSVKEDGNVGIGTTNPTAKLDVRGRTKTTCLEITGGCDIKEDLNSAEKLEPGDVVVIDEKNPGQIRRTHEEYDRKVAGIISGANGINPGMSLSQDDVLEGEFPLTMLGRVYVKVTGMVEIGDMLTTSSKPGFAMSVKDFSKAHGTVIGKAMTSNESGEGMVLVLVNLQ